MEIEAPNPPAESPFPSGSRPLGRRAILGLLGAGMLPMATPKAEAARFSTVVLDPGHGGHDNGAKWGGVPEKRLTLDLCQRIASLLKKRGVSAVLTRSSDYYVTLANRAAKANRYRSAVFVSIHFNAHWNRSVKGIESFYMSSSGRSLASRIQGRLAGRIRTTNRGIKSRSYSVLRNTRCTAALVECGFLSNSWERQRCNSTWFRQILAEEIAAGIIAYR